MVKLSHSDIGRHWKFSFRTPAVATNAAVKLREFNKRGCFLQPGSEVTVSEAAVTIEWRRDVKEKSLETFFYKGMAGEMRRCFGPDGSFQPWWVKLVRTHIVPETAAAPEPPNGYPSLPAEYQSCEFSKETCWGASLSDAYDANGFVIVRKFIPEYMTTPAADAVVNEFSKVVSSFTHGLSVPICEVNKIPGYAWEYVPGRKPDRYNPYAKLQKWGVATSIGYQQGLGSGQALSKQIYAKIPSIAAVQHYPKQFLAHLSKRAPERMCWQPEGVSVKGDGAPAANLHRNEKDEGRNQCIVILTAGQI